MNTTQKQTTGQDSNVLKPHRISTGDILKALGIGWLTFRAIPAPSMVFATLFALIGLVLLLALGRFGISPMALPFAGGFMLVGPAVLTGFFRLAAMSAEVGRPQLFDAFPAFVQAPAGLWLLALLCAFLFLIWITDAAILYTVMIGNDHQDIDGLFSLQGETVAFELWGMLMGSVLALIILAVSAFSVPLLHERRVPLVQAVSASVRGVFANFPTMIAWGLVLSAAIFVSILLLPLLTVVLPVLAYASFNLYRRVFPLCENSIE